MENTLDFLKVIYENVKKKTFISQQAYLFLRVTGILKFSDILFCTYCKGFFVFKKQSLCLYSSIYA